MEVDARGTRSAGALIRSDGQSIAAGLALRGGDSRSSSVSPSGADAAEGVAALDSWPAQPKN